jgi:hypothetical protein
MRDSIGRSIREDSARTPERSHQPLWERAMPKVVAIMSMSLDGYIADRNDGVAEVFDWQPDGDPGRRRYTPALAGTQGVVPGDAEQPAGKAREP